MIRLARLQVKRRVEDSSSLKPEPGQFVEAETRRGIEVAIADLEEHAEIDEVVLRRAHYTEEQVLGDWFPEEPPRCQDNADNHDPIGGDISRPRPILTK